jgi:excisionase family DNA binding protein
MGTKRVKRRNVVGDGGLLTLDEAGRFLGVCGATVRAMVKRGELPSLLVGKRSRRVPKDALVRYANARLEVEDD